MSDIWKQWIGLTIENRYPLRQYLAHTEHSAVFLTEFPDSSTGKAAIKFISADTPAAEKQLALWTRLSQFSHPGLLPIYRAGRCRITDMDLLYCVMQFAEETLSQILPQRPLSPEETQQMLEPVVDALVYLHEKGLVHTHIKPSNIVAAGDALKLTCDTAAPLGEARQAQRERDIYDAPETGATALAASADLWSLGETLVEALTQQTAALPFNDQEDPAVPSTLPQPFLDIARHSLRRDPARRWTSAQVAARLNPAKAPAFQPEPIAVAAAVHASTQSHAAVAAQSAVATHSSAAAPALSPLNVPLSSEPAVPLARLHAARSATLRPAPEPPLARPPASPEKDFVLPNYLVPALLTATLVLIAILAVPKLFRHNAKAGSSPTSAPAISAGTSTSASAPVRTPPSSIAPPAKAPSPDTSNDLGASQPAIPPSRSAANTPSPASHANNSSAPAAAAVTPSADSPAAGDVLNQVLPAAPAKALSTINGTVRVTVRVQVDPAGRVSDADLFAPGPSKYFAGLALQAARQWTFVSPESNGRSAPSEWLIRFEFSRQGPKASATQSVE